MLNGIELDLLLSNSSVSRLAGYNFNTSIVYS